VTPTEDAKIAAHMAANVIRKQFPVKAAVLQKIVTAGKKSKSLPSGFLAYL
jgi:hypothetical protein